MKDFTEGNATRQIILFALPMLIGNIFQQLYNVVDAVVVGRYIGGQALAAVGTSAPVMTFLLSALIGLTTGASVVISQFYGAGQYDNLRRTVSTSILFLGGLVICVSIFGYIFSPAFLRALDVPADIFDDAAVYLRIVMAGLVFPLFYNVFTAYLRAFGDSKNPLFFLIISTALNIVLDILFVTSFKMGVSGVAYATVISQAIATILCFVYTNIRVPLLRIRIREMVFDSELFMVVLKYSVPTAIQLSVVSLASLTIQRLTNTFGSDAIAGFTAATKIDSFATMPLSNISMAISTFVAQNMGAGLVERAKIGFRSATLLMLGFGVIVSALAIIFGRQLVALFVSGSNIDGILTVGTEYLSVIAVFYFLFAIFFAFNGFFRGVGDAVIVMILTITSLTIRSVTAHILVYRFGFGPSAVAWSIPIGWGLCSIICYFYYKHNLWAGKVAIAKVSPQDESVNILP